MSLLPMVLLSSPCLSSWYRLPLMRGLPRDYMIPATDLSVTYPEDWRWLLWQGQPPSERLRDRQSPRQQPLAAWLIPRWIVIITARNSPLALLLSREP